MAGNKIVANLNAALEATKDYDGVSEQEFLGPYASIIAMLLILIFPTAYQPEYNK